MMQKTLFLSLALAFFSISARAQSATYIANSGVLIEYSATKILIDAIFDQYNLKLAAPSESTIQKIMNGNSPYDGVDLVLVTHSHRDHFNPELAVKYLNTHQDVRMIAPPQSLDSMKFYSGFKKISSHVYSYPWKRAWKQLIQDNITVRSIYTRHGGRNNFQNQNQMFLITIGDKKILHVGDTQMEPDNYENLRLIYEDIDLAIVPFWYMSSVYGKELIDDYIKPKKVVAVHFPVTGAEESIQKIQDQFPNDKIFLNEGEKVSF